MNIGDKVKWVHCKTRARGFSMKTRTGTIEVLTKESARIGVSPGVFYWCPLNLIRPIDAPSALFDWIQSKQPEKEGA